MGNLLGYSEKYLEQADWKDISLIKLCTCSLGVMIGASVCDKAKKPVKLGAKLLFVATCVPLAIKAASVLLDEVSDEEH